MTSLQQLLYLMEQYCNNKYDTSSFTSQFVKIYYIEHDDSINQEIKELLKEIADYSKYYSPFESDFEKTIGRQIYRNEKQIKNKAKDTYLKLLNYYDVPNLISTIQNSDEEDYKF